MRIAEISLAVLSVVMIGSTVLCGLWLKFHRQQANLSEGIDFHMKRALATTAVVLATIVMLLVKAGGK